MTQAAQPLSKPGFIFHTPPEEVWVFHTEECSTPHPDLFIYLLKQAPVVGKGRLGPMVYKDPAHKLKGHLSNQQDVYGWDPKAERVAKERLKCTYFIALGINENPDLDKSVIYFTLASRSLSLTPTIKDILSYTPSALDSRIFAVSYKTFKELISTFYIYTTLPSCTDARYLRDASRQKPPQTERRENKKKETPSSTFSPSAPSQTSYLQDGLSTTERTYLDRLIALDLDSILDEGAGEKACREIGEEVSQLSGLEGMQRICGAIKSTAKDGRLRAQYIDRAWHLIGDADSRWMS